MLTNDVANAIVGRVFSRVSDGLTYTVTSASTYERIRVFDPRTNTYLAFDSKETFENWAYGKPVLSANR